MYKSLFVHANALTLRGFFRVCSTLISQDMVGNMLGVVRGKGKRDSDGQRNFMFTPLAHDCRKDMKKTEGRKHYTHTLIQLKTLGRVEKCEREERSFLRGK